MHVPSLPRQPRSTNSGVWQQLDWPRLLLWLGAILTVAALLLPTVYLLVRAIEAREAALTVLQRPQTWQVMANSLGLAAATTFVAMLIGVPLAWLTTRTDLPGRRFWAVITPLPLVLPSYVGAYLYASALGPRGLLQQVLEVPFGITRLPSIYGFAGALFVLSMLTYPYVLLNTRAALQRLDPALEEAARSLGYGPRAVFWKIILPQLRPALGASGLLVALYTLRDFAAVALMRFDTFTRIIYVQYRSFDRSQAAYFALLLIGVTLIFVALEAQMQRAARYDRVGAGASRPPLQVSLGRWRWPAIAFCASVVSLGLFIPIAVLLYWLILGLNAGENFATLGPATINSLLVAALGGLITLVAALPTALLVVRRPNRLSHLLERLTYSAYALPGIAVALALVFFSIAYARPLYQTLPLLLFAYFVLFLPQAVGALRGALLQVSPSVEEAARSLGHGPLRVFWKITLPLIRPGALAGFTLVFLTIMKELPATLILAPLGFRSLATEIWSAVSEAFFARAAAPALLILLLSSLPLALMSLRKEQTNL